MLVNETFFINSCDDYELNIKRKSKLEFRISYDDTKELKAIVFDIGGFGANTNLSFLDSARVALAKKFNILVVHVFHHCFAIRHNEQDKRYSCTFEMNDEGLKQLEMALNFFNLKAKDGLSKANAFSISIELGKLLVQLKKEGKIEDKSTKNVRKFLAVPPNDEYQNYGVMAALDHINALKFIQNTFKLHHLPTIVGGGVLRCLYSKFDGKILSLRHSSCC